MTPRAAADALVRLVKTAGPLNPPSLIHWTKPGAKSMIMAGNELRGNLAGTAPIFALPAASARNSNLFRSLVRAGISPANNSPVSIPLQAASNFRGVAPLGPYSLTKYLGGVHVAPPGKVNLLTGVYTQTGSPWVARRALYGPDAAIYGAGLGAGLYAKLRNRQPIPAAATPPPTQPPEQPQEVASAK